MYTREDTSSSSLREHGKQWRSLSDVLNGTQRRVLCLPIVSQQLQAHAPHDLNGSRQPLQQIEQRNDLVAFQDQIRLPATDCATIAAVEQNLQRGCYACEVECN